jgi:hypothetical protein
MLLLTCSQNQKYGYPEVITKRDAVTSHTINATVIDQAIDETRNLRWATSSNATEEYADFGALSLVRQYFMLSLVCHSDPIAAHSVSGETVVSRIVAHLDSAVAGAREPSCRGAIGGWADGPFAMGLALNKQTPAVWDALSAATKEKLDWLMQSLAIAGNYTQNYENNAGVDLYRSFNFRKHWNPNIQEGYVAVMIAAYLYFGSAEAVNTILAAFDYDTYISQLTNLGLTNIVTCWQQSGKTLMEDGGSTDNGGEIVGVREPFTYKLLPVDYGPWPEDLKSAAQALVDEGDQVPYEPSALYETLALKFYSWQVETEPRMECFINNPPPELDPLKGKWGMAYEFNSGDASGLRCSARYVYDGWSINACTLSGLLALGQLNETIRIAAVFDRVLTGSDHFLIASEATYTGRSNGEIVTQGAAGFNSIGYPFPKAVYEGHIRPAIGG